MDGALSGPVGRPKALSDVLALGFGTTVAMWAVGYAARLPVVQLPAPVVLVALLAVLVLGGYAAGAWGARGVAGGIYAGSVTGLLNLLVLGSFLTARDRPNEVLPGAALWVPGSIAVSAALGGAGALLGARRRPRSAPARWNHVFACVAVAATFLLLIAGGLVTSNKAGLAVVDWPNSYGYNMFLYPFSRMTGGIYYEHAHRLLGALVGLTTFSLLAVLGATEERRWVKGMSASAAALVVVQGILGGLRVTGKPTLSTDPAMTAPNIYLAVVHGVTAQIFFSLLVALAVVTSPAWQSDAPGTASPRAAGERRLASISLLAVILQIVFGAIQRHLAIGLMLHIASAFVVAILLVASGIRAWGFYQEDTTLRRAGSTVVVMTVVQFGFGFSAWIVRGAWENGAVSEAWKVAATTLHQGTGAIVLGSIVALRLWLSRRLIDGDPAAT
jgi:cytochrome c oxidase assembly protein subunit 15